MKAEYASGASVCGVIIDLVSEVESCPPVELPPLYETIDPDVLENLCAEQSTDAGRSNCKISFDYSNSNVVVEQSGFVTVSHDVET